jgi:hypothetical protein
MGCLRGILANNDIEAKENIRIDKETFISAVQDKGRFSGLLDTYVPLHKETGLSLFMGNNGAYIPEVNIEFFELLQKHPNEYLM